jgi:hypothetical protein
MFVPRAASVFEAIVHEFNRFGAAIEGAGSMPTTLWMISDGEAEALAARTVALANRYLNER